MNANTEKIIKELYTEIVSKYNDKYLNNTLTYDDGDELFNEIIFKKYLNIDPESERGQKIKNREEYLSYDETLLLASVVRGTIYLPNTRWQEKETSHAYVLLASHYASMVLANLYHWGLRFDDLRNLFLKNKLTDDQKQKYVDIVKMKEIIASTGKELKKSDDSTSVQQSIVPTDDQEKESNNKDSLQKRIRELENDPRVKEYISVRCKLCEIELCEEMAEKEQQQTKS